jgi:hypothetical protein
MQNHSLKIILNLETKTSHIVCQYRERNRENIKKITKIIEKNYLIIMKFQIPSIIKNIKDR